MTTEDETDLAVELHDVCMAYPGANKPAVRDVSLSVRTGEFLTLLGPSGSGKTTLLNLMAGFIQPTAGTITIGGRDVTGVPAYKRDVGLVFQNYALFPHMTAAQNVEFPLRQRGMSRAEARKLALEALDLVQLGALGSRHPGELSGGQQQRVALARAIVYRPPLLLLDEPLGALDKKLREQLQVELTRLHRELGLTFLFVTHDQEEAMSMSDRVAVFNAGVIEQVGTPKELYTRPASVFVADFLGESNMFDGVVDGGGVFRGPDIQVDVRCQEIGEGPACLVVRPEDAQLYACGSQPDAGATGIKAELISEIYLGGTLKYLLRFPDGRPGVVRGMPTDQGRWAVGDSVLMTWNVDKARVVSR